MNLGEIREECWDIALERGSFDADRFWPESEMNRYINRIYYDIAKQTRCIRDATTPAVVLIDSIPVDYTTYTEGTLDYEWANDSSSWLYQKNVAPYLHDLHSSIIEVEEAKWVSRQWKLIKVSSLKWRQHNRWEQVIGTPTEFATDLESRKLAVNFRDDTTDKLQLVVKRLPLSELSDDTDTPEFVSDYHDYFLHGVLWFMYRKQDMETFDANKASEYKNLYKQDLDEIKQRETLLENHLRPNAAYGAMR